MDQRIYAGWGSSRMTAVGYFSPYWQCRRYVCSAPNKGHSAPSVPAAVPLDTHAAILTEFRLDGLFAMAGSHVSWPSHSRVGV
jgi:hypothetical protein